MNSARAVARSQPAQEGRRAPCPVDLADDPDIERSEKEKVETPEQQLQLTRDCDSQDSCDTAWSTSTCTNSMTSRHSTYVYKMCCGPDLGLESDSDGVVGTFISNRDQLKDLCMYVSGPLRIEIETLSPPGDRIGFCGRLVL